MKKIIFLALAIVISFAGFSQKVKLTKGNLSSVKGEDVFEVKFTYDNMKVGKMAEEAYVKNKKEEANKKDGDGGKRWHEAWLKDREARFEPKFIELFNKHASKKGIVIETERDNSKFIMVVNTYFTEPGFNVGIQSAPAYVSMTVSFVERSNPSTPVAVFDIIRARGATTYDLGWRIQESYALAGKAFAKALSKQL